MLDIRVQFQKFQQNLKSIIIKKKKKKKRVISKFNVGRRYISLRLSVIQLL